MAVTLIRARLLCVGLVYQALWLAPGLAYSQSRELVVESHEVVHVEV